MNAAKYPGVRLLKVHAYDDPLRIPLCHHRGGARYTTLDFPESPPSCRRCIKTLEVQRRLLVGSFGKAARP